MQVYTSLETQFANPLTTDQSEPRAEKQCLDLQIRPYYLDNATN